MTHGSVGSYHLDDCRLNLTSCHLSGMLWLFESPKTNHLPHIICWVSKKVYGSNYIMNMLQCSELFRFYASQNENSVSDDFTCTTSTPNNYLWYPWINVFRNISPMPMSDLWVSSWTTHIWIYIVDDLKWDPYMISFRPLYLYVPLYTIEEILLLYDLVGKLYRQKDRIHINKLYLIQGDQILSTVEV